MYVQSCCFVNLRPCPHYCVFKSMRFVVIDNTSIDLRPHFRFHAFSTVPITSSETQGRSVGREKRRDEGFQAQAEKPLGTDHFKRSSECWLLIGHKKCFVLLYPIGEQHPLSSFRTRMSSSRRWSTYCLTSLFSTTYFLLKFSMASSSFILRASKAKSVTINMCFIM